jgi:hypothetical protein
MSAARLRLPESPLGADLIWWRGSRGVRTTVTVAWGAYHHFPQSAHLEAFLFLGDGVPVAQWTMPLRADRPLVIDSADEGPWSAAPAADGLLVLYVCTDDPPGEEARKRFVRLYALVDWRSADGDLVTLHSDQVAYRGWRAHMRLTEIVVREDTQERNALVFLNGEEVQPAGAVVLDVTTGDGETRSAVYDVEMAPFTVHRLVLADLFPGIARQAGDRPLLVSGSFQARGLYTRPYVETTSGQRWSAHHAGNVYDWEALPFFAHALIGGQVNPMAVLHDRDTATFVNILHSHGDLESDVWVDADLFDLDGRRVAHRPRWLLARRHRLSRGEIAELVPDPALAFRGHVALRFAPERGQPVPRRLQALLEYRRAGAVARVMAWSDEWNSRVRLAERDRSESPPTMRSYYRVWCDTETETELAITNAGHPGYDRAASVRAVLIGRQGEVAHATFDLPPFATAWWTVRSLFPDATRELAPSGHGLVAIESTSDLANLAFSRHRRSGALAVEHFMVWQTEHAGAIVKVAGG